MNVAIKQNLRRVYSSQTRYRYGVANPFSDNIEGHPVDRLEHRKIAPFRIGPRRRGLVLWWQISSTETADLRGPALAKVEISVESLDGDMRLAADRRQRAPRH